MQRQLESERDRARLEKQAAEDRAREAEERVRESEERVRVVEGERDEVRMEKDATEEEVRVVEGERDGVMMELQQALARNNELQQRLGEVKGRESEKLVVQEQAAEDRAREAEERVRVEGERMREAERKAEEAAASTREADKEVREEKRRVSLLKKENIRMKAERKNIEEKCRKTEALNVRLLEGNTGMKYSIETLQRKANELEREKNGAIDEMKAVKLDSELNQQETFARLQSFRARTETLENERDKDKLKAEHMAEAAETRLEEERNRAYHERDLMRLKIQTQESRAVVAEERLRMLEAEKDTIQQNVVEKMQHTATVELQSERDGASQAEERLQALQDGIEIVRKELESEKNKQSTIIEHLKQHSLELEGRALAAEEKAKIFKEEMVRMKRDIRDRVLVMENEKQAVDESMREAMDRTKVMENERSRAMSDKQEAEARAIKAEAKIQEIEGERDTAKFELHQALARANTFDQKLEEIKGREQDLEVHELALTTEKQDSSSDLKETMEAKIIAVKTVQVTNEEKHIVWEEYGLRLHIPSNSLPENCSQFELKMSVSRSQHYKLPDDDGILVSAVYSFSHTLGHKKLQKPVTVEMQHCVANSAYNPLCILQAEDTSDTFSVIEGGTFDHNEGYGVIELRHFCSLAVYLQWFVASLFWTLKPCARLYYTNIKSRSFEFHLYIVPHLSAIIQVCTLYHLVILCYSLMFNFAGD